MESDKLPPEYDAIVLGTGMTESLIAAALSRIGYSVLHLDRNDFYSGDGCSFHFEGLQQWIKRHQNVDSCNEFESKIDITKLLNEGEKAINMNMLSSAVSNVTQLIHILESLPGDHDISTTVGEISVANGNAATEIMVPVSEQSGNIGTAPIQAEPKVSADDSMHRHSKNETETEEVDREQSGKMPSSAELTEPAGEQHLKVSTSTTAQDSQRQQDVGDIVEDIKLAQGGADASEDVSPNDLMTPKSSPSEPTESVGDTCRRRDWCMADLTKDWRRFNIDLLPKVLYCSGAMVNLLISSDVAKYCEFKTVSRILTVINGQVEQVPCSRSDVFSNQKISMMEKRLLMKLLTTCLNYDKQPDEFKGSEDKPFIEFLKTRKLTDTLCHYIQHAIAMVDDAATTAEGLQATQKFLQSLGRFGNTAFLWPHYGSGELSQCFCRMCAVFGGVYCLRRTAHSLVVNSDNKLVAVVDSTGQRLTTKWLIAESSYATSQLFSASTNRISRAVLITDRSILKAKDDYVSLLHVPSPDNSQHHYTMFELSYVSSACPKDLYIIHIRCPSKTGDPVADMMPVIKQMFSSEVDDDDRPRILWSLYFTLTLCTDITSTTLTPDNCLVVPGADNELDFDSAIAEAKKIFEKICPGDEFLPKAPNPEDIIYVDDEETSGSQQGGFEITTEDVDANAASEVMSAVPENSAAEYTIAEETSKEALDESEEVNKH